MFQIVSFHFSCLLSGIKDNPDFDQEMAFLHTRSRCHYVICRISAYSHEVLLGYETAVFNGEQEKILYLCKCRIEKSSPSRSAYAKKQPSGWIFLSHPHTHDGYL